MRSQTQELSEICRDLHCQRDRYTWTSHPSLEGTRCGDDMVIINLNHFILNNKFLRNFIVVVVQEWNVHFKINRTISSISCGPRAIQHNKYRQGSVKFRREHETRQFKARSQL